jgi:hypothetical protein
MECPNCGNQVADDASICDHCDFILDKSFLGDDFTDDGDQAAAEVDQGQAAAPQRSSRRRPEPEDDEEMDELEKEMQALRERRRVSQTPVPTTTTVKESETLEEESGKIAKDIEGVLGKYWKAFKALQKPDKLLVGGGAGLALFSFFPWVSFAGVASLIGLEVGGWFTLLMGGAIISLVFLRGQKHWRDKQKYILYAQLGVAGLAVLFVLIRMGSLGSVGGDDIGSELHKSLGASLGVGLVLCLAASVTMAVGAFILFKAKVLKK